MNLEKQSNKTNQEVTLMNHFVSMKDLSAGEIQQLIKLAEQYERGQYSNLTKEGKRFVANLFYEPSTRTKMSFEVAEKKLGLEILDFHCDSSSEQKGESIYDTAKTFSSIGAEALIIRHPVDNQVQLLAEQLPVPVINAGDGKGEHPTQSLLDLYTMYKEFSYFKDLKVLMVGDILHSRVARSNALALKTLGAEVFLSCPKEWQDPNIDYPYLDLDEAIEHCDVAMLLRIQLERHQHQTNLSAQQYLARYGLTKEREQRMKSNAIIMHPAPVNRNVEIEDCLVECERSRIFKQMEYGVYTRMAVLNMLLNKGDEAVGENHQTMYAHAQQW